MEGKKFTKLENALKGLKKPELSLHQKSQIRENLLHSIKHSTAAESYPSLEKIKELVKAVAAKTQPSVYFKTKVKESLLSVIEKTKIQSPFLSSFARNWQKVLAGSLVVLISMTTFATIYISDIPVTKAAPQTTLIEYIGNVDVIREDIYIEVSDDMVLMEGDIIITGRKSTAIIRYFDDSLSRLSSESELKLIKLYQDDEKKSQTEVEVELNKGRVWNQVVNLSGKNSKFQVEVKQVSAQVNKKASFDIKVNDKEEPEVTVFENKVKVELPNEPKTTKHYILEGYTIAAAEVVPEIEKITFNSVEDEVWIEGNKEKDREYKKEIDKEKTEDAKEQAGLTPENPLYGAKKLNESTKLLLAGEEDKTKLKIDIAIKRLNEAAVYFEEGRQGDAEDLLSEFNSIFSEISDEIVDSEQLQEYLENAIAEEEKDLSTVLPDSPKYEVKEALREAKKNTAQTDQEVKEVILEGTEEKLIEVKELIKEEKDDYAQETLEEVIEEVIDVAHDDVASEDDAVIEEHVENLSTVKVLEEILEEEDVTEELIDLVETTKIVLEEDIEVSFDSWEIVEEELHPVVSDIAVILPLD
jgi:hypothetical protein